MNFIRIVILNYNSAQYTLDLIHMLDAQLNRHFEIVVVDNASKASDIEILNNGLPSSIHFVRSSANLGYSGGNNLGMQLDNRNKVDYFLILNDDVIIENPHFLDKMLEGFEQTDYGHILASSPLVDTLLTKKPVAEQIQVRKLLPVYQMYIISFAIMNRIFKTWFNQFIYKQEIPYHEKYLPVDSINGAAFMVKADFMEQNGYLDDGVFLFHEELILGKQIQNAGGTCLLNGFVSLKHLQGVSTTSNKKRFNTRMERFKYQSEIYLYRNYFQMNGFSLGLFSILKELEIIVKRLMFSVR